MHNQCSGVARPLRHRHAFYVLGSVVIEQVHCVLKFDIPLIKVLRKSAGSYIFTQRRVWTVNPEEELVLVPSVEVVAVFVFATDPLVRDQKVATSTQAHEDVIVQISVRDDVLQAELQSALMCE